MGGRRHKQWVLLVHLKWKSNFKRLAEFMWKESEKRRKRERTPKRTKIGGKEEERMQANGQKYCLAQMSCSERHCKSCGPEERQWSSITSCSVLNFRQEQREEWRGERTGMEKRGGEWEWNGQRKHLNHEKAVRKMMQRRRLLFCHVTQSADQIFWKHISFLPCSIPLTDGQCRHHCSSGVVCNSKRLSLDYLVYTRLSKDSSGAESRNKHEVRFRWRASTRLSRLQNKRCLALIAAFSHAIRHTPETER